MRATALAFVLSSSFAAADEFACKQHLQSLPAPIHPMPGRKYARDRLIDLLHLKLDVRPDFQKRTIAGTATLTFKPVGRALSTLTLDAVGLEVESITASNATLGSQQNTGEQLILDFTSPVPVDAEAGVVIRYHVQPENGIYFRTPEMGYKAEDTQLWTQGEAELHRYWFPCYDYPNERFTSEVICHVPGNMEVVSNGHLVASTPEAGGIKAVHWSQDKPHANYLIALAAGMFHKLEAKAGELPIAMYVPVSEKDQAANAFRDTAKIIAFYNQEIGVPFAWDKYFQVYCHDFLAGGMENTSCTFEASSMLFKDDTEQLNTLHRLDAHETAHQWFGDLVTCRDWSHLWLNEGFASYYTILYEEHRNGRDAMLHELWMEAQGVLQTNDTRPTVWRDYSDAMEQFDYRVYPKGAWILHMIRSRLGPDLYRRCIKTYLERHRFGVVGTDDLHDVLDELTGLSWDQFFDQWLYHGGVPDLAITYSYDAATKLVKLNVRQQQKLSDQVRLFAFDLPVRLFSGEAQTDFSAKVSKDTEDFYFPAAKAPELVRIDPDYTLLAKVQFTPPGDMLKRQLKGDLIGRMLAVQKLGERDDHESISTLKSVLNEDAFFAVRAEAGKALRKIGDDEARAALIASVQQPDARVRSEVVSAIGAFHTPDALEALRKQELSEKNPAIITSILRSLGGWAGDKEAGAILRKRLQQPSYHERIASAAIAALRGADDASAVADVRARLAANTTEFGGRALGEAMDALAFLARNDKDRAPVREMLAARLSDPRPGVRTAAAKALGTLRDPAAIAVLEPLTLVAKPFNDPVRDAAEKSVQVLQTQLESPAELQRVWQRLQDMTRESDKLKKDLEALKKQARPAEPVKKK